jgi:hypothetical protein
MHLMDMIQMSGQFLKLEHAPDAVKDCLKEGACMLVGTSTVADVSHPVHDCVGYCVTAWNSGDVGMPRPA